MNQEKGLTLFTAALKFASFKHRFQKRKSQDVPYINHPIDVVDILAKAGVTDYEILSAAILHDTVEDTETSPEELEKEFGVRVKNLVMECTDDKSLPKADRKIVQIAKSKKSSHDAKLIKIADKLSNCWDVTLKSPPSWSQERVFGYFLWAHAVCRGLTGVNEKLDAEMDRLWKEVKVVGLAPEVEEAKLKEYYKILAESKGQK